MNGNNPNQKRRARLFSGYVFDPRDYQIAALLTLLTCGILVFDFSIPLFQALLIITTALGAQFACTILFKLPKFDPKSAFTSALSLCLLLRVGGMEIAIIAATLTIASKFLLRINNKHIFNPTVFGIIATMLLFDTAWVSPGQWGTVALLGFLILCLGGVVVTKAARADVTFTFLSAYSALLVGRALYLGDPMIIPLHQLQSGALLIFAFFMISDPKTTPNSRRGRIVFALLVAALAGILQFGFYINNAPLWALSVCCLTTSLFDYLMPGAAYQWQEKKTTHQAIPLGGTDEKFSPAIIPLRVGRDSSAGA